MDPAPNSELVHYTDRGEGPALVLVHGLMMTGEMFAPVLDRLSAHFRVITPDLRGHGQSRHLPPPFTVAELAADLSRLLDHLYITSTAVLGYSHGGTVAQQLVVDDRVRCTRLILACTYAYNMASARERVESHVGLVLIRALGLRGLARLIFAPVRDELGPAQALRLTELMARQDKALMLQAWREMMRFDSRPWLARIACPTLVVAASNDIGVPAHHARALHQGIPGSELVVVTGADHALIWTHTEQFLSIVEAFLDPSAPNAR